MDSKVMMSLVKINELNFEVNILVAHFEIAGDFSVFFQTHNQSILNFIKPFLNL